MTLDRRTFLKLGGARRSPSGHLPADDRPSRTHPKRPHRPTTRFASRLASSNWTPKIRVQRGKRYRLRMRNASDDIHPMHLHRHSFELTKVAGRQTGGVMKDVVMLGGYQEMDVDFTADSPGLSLFHCHMQLHMDRFHGAV
jgi:FtsP/CotA-like multicopper oxidase with cupredoxin domain